MSLSRPTNFNSVDQVDHVAASSSHFRRNFSRKNIQDSLVPPPIQPYGGRSSRSDPFSTISSRDDQSSERQSRPHHGSRLHDPYTERSSRPDHGSVIQDLFNARTSRNDAFNAGSSRSDPYRAVSSGTDSAYNTLRSGVSAEAKPPKQKSRKNPPMYFTPRVI